MKELEYPLVCFSKDNNSYPSDGICPVCESARVHEPHQAIHITGGALMSTSEDEAGPDSRMKGILDLVWHEAHEVEGVDSSDIDGFDEQDTRWGLGPEEIEQKPAMLPLVEHSADGLFGLSVCSTACLRTFLNRIVDDFQARTDAK